MSKKIVRLSESDLHNIIKESVQNILNEIYMKNYNPDSELTKNDFRY